MARTTGSDDLFRLIHSLTTEEKGYFKKFAKRHTSKGTATLQLFDTISRQKEFEEKSLKKKFKNYAVMKVNLFDEIMRCLMINLKKTDTEIGLLQKLIQCSILQNKGLQNEAIALNKEGLAIAESHEIFWLQEHFFRKDMRYSETNIPMGERTQKYLDFYKYVKEVRAKHVNKDDYLEASYHAFNMIQEKTYQGNSKIELDTLVDVEFLTNKKHSLSRGNERHRLNALARYYQAKDDLQKAHSVFKELHALEELLRLKESPLYNPTFHWLSLRVLIFSCFNVRDYGDIPLLLEKFLSTGHEQKRFQEDTILVYHLRYLDFYWRTGKHKEEKQFYEEKVAGLIGIKRENSNKGYDMHFFMAKILCEYSLGNYRQAMLGISELQALGANKMAPRFQADAEWLKLLIHLKTEDYNLAHTTANQFLKQMGETITPMEREVLPKFKKISLQNRKQALSSALEVCAKYSPVLLFENLDLKTALEQILNAKPLAEAVKKYFE